MANNDQLFDLGESLYASVTVFNENLYVHIRVYVKWKFPTKNGVSLMTTQWETFMKLHTKKGTPSTNGITV